MSMTGSTSTTACFLPIILRILSYTYPGKPHSSLFTTAYKFPSREQKITAQVRVTFWRFRAVNQSC